MNSDRPVCLLTGGGGYLGSLFCGRFANSHRIAAVWHRRRPVAATQDQCVEPLAPDSALAKNGAPVFAVKGDLRKPAHVQRVVDTVLDRFGRIDVVVNAAVSSMWAPMLDGSALVDSLDDAFRVNVGVPLAVSTVVANEVWKDAASDNVHYNRCVVNVSSSASVRVYAGYGQSVYGASKAALNTLTRHMAAEFEPIGVRERDRAGFLPRAGRGRRRARWPRAPDRRRHDRADPAGRTPL